MVEVGLPPHTLLLPVGYSVLVLEEEFQVPGSKEELSGTRTLPRFELFLLPSESS